jgi:hypothetical protein
MTIKNISSSILTLAVSLLAVLSPVALVASIDIYDCSYFGKSLGITTRYDYECMVSVGGSWIPKRYISH